MQFNNPPGKIKDNMTTRRLIESIGRSSSRLVPIIAKPIKSGMRMAKSNCAFATKGILAAPTRVVRLSIVAFFFLLAGLAGLTGVFAGKAQVLPRSPRTDVLAREAQAAPSPSVPPPTCPGPDCQKKITIFNNTAGPIWVAIQTAFQNPDPWLQAVFNDSNNTYQETHYSRVYPNYPGGIPAGGYIRVTVPWFSHLVTDPPNPPNHKDEYADWFNGGRIAIFDSFAAVELAHDQDRNNRLSVRPDSPLFCCENCATDSPLSIYSDTQAYHDERFPFQLAEYTFVNVKSPPGGTPYIIDLNVGYDTSDVDQLYLPVAISPCLREPVSWTCPGPDPNAVGYLGTTLSVGVFSQRASQWLADVGWIRYKSVLDSDSHPRIPGAYFVIADRIAHPDGAGSLFTCPPPGSAITNMINLWQTCTGGNPNKECPQADLYKEVNDYFKENYDTYWNNGVKPMPCGSLWPNPSPVPGTNYPSPLGVMLYVYGFVPFNFDCGAGFNDLKVSPGPQSRYNKVLDDYIHKLQYNYKTIDEPKWFNAYTELVHEKLEGNVYAFSIDDASGFQNRPGEGIVIAIGGSNGLPNPNPIPNPTPPPPVPDFTKDFEVALGDSVAQHRPCWTSYSVCDGPEKQFPPPTYEAKGNPVQAPHIIVDTTVPPLSLGKPCTIILKDAANQVYQFNVKMPVPWPDHAPPGFDPSVVECSSGLPPGNWCTQQLGEQAFVTPDGRQFVLYTAPPNETQPAGQHQCPTPTPTPTAIPIPTPTGTPPPSVCGNATPPGTPIPTPTGTPTPSPIPTSTACPP